MKRIILDVDTGVDDALAIALAVRHPEVQLEAVVAVAGNVRLELTARNSLRVLDWLGATDVSVYRGADGPLSGEVREASQWHGPDGLGGARAFLQHHPFLNPLSLQGEVLSRGEGAYVGLRSRL